MSDTIADAPAPSRTLLVTIPGPMRGKQRARVVRRGAFASSYTPKETVNAEAWVRHCAVEQVGQPCLEGPHSFPLRSEAVLLNVERMHTPQVLSHWAPRKLHWAAESFAWDAIMMSGGLHPWRVMQQQRMVVDPGIVWHVSAGDEAYHALAGRYGLTLDEDMTAMGNASLQDYVLG